MELEITRGAVPPPVEPRERWHDAEGRLVAWSCWKEAGALVEVAGTAVYRLDRGADTIRVYARPNVLRQRLEAEYRRVVRPLFAQARGWQVLHASAIATTSGVVGVVGLVGRSGSGKSTLATAWAATEGTVWADDALTFRVADSRPETRRLDASAEERVACGPGTRPLLALTELETLTRPEDCETLTRLSRAEALVALLPHALSLDPESPELARGLFEAYADLSRHVPVYRLRYRQTSDAPARWTRSLRRRIAGDLATVDPAARGPAA